VGDELRAVDGDPRAVGVREAREVGEGQALTRHVGRARDREQRGRRPRQLVTDRPQGLRQGRPRLDGPRPGYPCAGCPRTAGVPGQQVRVMLDVQVHHGAWHRGREEVERVRGVPREDHDVVTARAGEPGKRRPGGLVGAGADRGGVARAPVHA